MTKIAIVTGGSRGLGREMALHLAAKGRDLILTYHSKEDEAHEVVAQIEKLGQRAVALQLDTSKVETFAAFAGAVKSALSETFGAEKFDFLVNNAGIGANASLMETTEDQFDQMVNIHFKGVFFLTQKLLPLMNDGGRIVNISSGLARFSSPGYAAYGAAKGAVETLTRYMAQELGERRIAVNVVAPGAIATDFGGGMVRDNEKMQAGLSAQTALGRVGQPEDIGGVVASLLSDDNAWINGQRIEASGGFLL